MILFYFLVSVMPLVQHPLWSHFVGDLTITKYVGISCVAYAVIHLAIRHSMPGAFRSSVVKLFVAFYLLAMYSYLTQSLPSAWQISPILSYSSFLFLLFVTGVVVDSIPRLRWTLFVAIGSLGFASLYVLREWQKYHNLVADLRPGWVLGDANYYTLSAVLCIPLAFLMGRQNRPVWEKALLYGSLLVTLIGVVLGASRGGFLGLIAAFLFVIWHSPSRGRYIAVGALVVVPLLLFAPSTPLTRLLHPNFSDQDAAQERIIVWKAGEKMIKTHPLLGVGLGNFKPLVTQYEDDGDMRVETLAHNTYIEITAEMGIPGLLLFLGILFASMRTLSRVYKRAPEDAQLLKDAALGIQAGLVGATVGIFFLSCETQRLLWLMLFLTPCVQALAAQLEEEESENATIEEVSDELVPVNAEGGSENEYGAEQWT